MIQDQKASIKRFMSVKQYFRLQDSGIGHTGEGNLNTPPQDFLNSHLPVNWSNSFLNQMSIPNIRERPDRCKSAHVLGHVPVTDVVCVIGSESDSHWNQMSKQIGTLAHEVQSTNICIFVLVY